MEISNIIDILWRRKWVIIATVGLTLAVAAGVTMLFPKKYQVTTLMRATTPKVNNYVNLGYADRLNNTYAQVIKSEAVLNELKTRLNLERVPEISLRVIANSELMELTVETERPEIANTLAEILIEQSSEIYFGDQADLLSIMENHLAEVEGELDALLIENGIDPKDLANAELPAALQPKIDLILRQQASLLYNYEQVYIDTQRQQVTLSVVRPATPPTGPYSPRPLVNMALGGALGMVAALGLAFLFENMDSKLYTSKQLENLMGLPILGRIPSQRRLKNPLDLSRDFVQREMFRQLRTNIQARIQEESQTPILLIVSPDPEEGKSTITANLATAFARNDLRALIIDGDLRRPRQHECFGLSNMVGLSSVLNRELALQNAIQFHEDTRVHVLPSGPIPANPTELLASAHMKQLIEELRGSYDIIFIDSPALTAVADTMVLTALATGSIMVVARGRSRRAPILTALDQLRYIKANILGAVINRAERMRQVNYYHRPTPTEVALLEGSALPGGVGQPAQPEA